MLAPAMPVRQHSAADGSVQSAVTEASTMGNNAVEDCLNGRIMRLSFPSPTEGSTVVVSCPFLFSPG